MAVVDRNSTFVAAKVAGTLSDVHNGSGRLVSVLGALTVAADDSANSIHRVVRVPANASVRSIKLSTGDATTAGAFNLGVYYPTDFYDASLAGDVIDADFFASAFDLTGGPFTKAELAFESAVFDNAKQVQPLWQALGLAKDPQGELDIAVTITTTYNGAATSQLFEVVYAGQ